jgi:transposase InsO family protein
MADDITYIPTWGGWVYLAAVIDCATRKMIEWGSHREQLGDYDKVHTTAVNRV